VTRVAEKWFGHFQTNGGTRVASVATFLLLEGAATYCTRFVIHDSIEICRKEAKKKFK
jgi:hypothetical protein